MNKSTIVLVSLLLVLGAVTYFLLPSQKEHESSYEPVDVNVKVDSASIVKIQIDQKAKSVAMENVGGKWMITSPIRYAADQAAIRQLLGGLSKFKVGSLISSNPEKQNLFQVDSSGTKLLITDRSNKSVSIIVGKMGPSFSEVYFRVPSSKDVYLGEGLDTWTINKEVKEWRDKSILSAPAEAVKELTYTLANKEVQFQHDTSGWKSGGKPVDAGTVTPALNQLANLHADDFIDTLMKIETHPTSVRVRAAEDATLNLYPSTPDSAKYFVQVAGSPQLFVISKWTAQQILKPVEPASAPPKPPAQIARKKKPPASSPTITGENKEALQRSAEQSAAPPKKVETSKTPRTETAAAPKKEPAVTALRHDSVSAPSGTQAQPHKPNPVSRRTEPSAPAAQKTQNSESAIDNEGDLTVHTVKRGETMTTIAKQYGVSVEEILKWNLLKSIGVKPGQELYIYVKK
jgi:LysM repeat protein